MNISINKASSYKVRLTKRITTPNVEDDCGGHKGVDLNK